MSVDLVIKSGRVVTPGGVLAGGVALHGGNRRSHVDFFLQVYRHFFNAYKPWPTEGLAWFGGGPAAAGGTS